MMRRNSSVDLSLFLLIAKIGKTRGLKGEFFLRSYAQNPETLFSFKKFYALSTSAMEEVHFEFMRESNSNIVAKLKSINDIDEIKAYGQKDIFVLKSELPKLDENEAYWFELEDPDTGSEIGTKSLGMTVLTPPQIAAGKMFVLGVNGTLNAFE